MNDLQSECRIFYHAIRKGYTFEKMITLTSNSNTCNMHDPEVENRRMFSRWELTEKKMFLFSWFLNL